MGIFQCLTSTTTHKEFVGFLTPVSLFPESGSPCLCGVESDKTTPNQQGDRRENIGFGNPTIASQWNFLHLPSDDFLYPTKSTLDDTDTEFRRNHLLPPSFETTTFILRDVDTSQ